MMYKVPEDWAFPYCNSEGAFQCWHCGDPYAGLVEPHAIRGEREKNTICERQYQNIGHCENVDEHGDIWPCTILVQAYHNQQQKDTTEEETQWPNGCLAAFTVGFM
jgi:hypothetical protein